MIKPYHETGDIRIYHGDSTEILPQLDVEATACVTDPPYGLAFMGRDWDDFDPKEYQKWCEGWARVVKDAMLPGAPLLAFSGTRTFHRAICGIEDAGFTLKDALAFMYGSGFPKSHDLSKAIDQHKGKKDEREVVAKGRSGHNAGMQDLGDSGITGGEYDKTAPATDEAETWDGYGTSLAPSWEPVCYATKPRDGTYAENALEHGVAGLNIDGARVEAADSEWTRKGPIDDIRGGNWIKDERKVIGDEDTVTKGGEKGRWPANVIFDEEAARQLDAEVGHLHGNGNKSDTGNGQDAPYDSSSYEVSYEGRAHRDYGKEGGGPSRYFKTVSWGTKVVKLPFLLHTTSGNTDQSSLDQCCENASFAVLSSMLDRMLSDKGTGSIVAESASGKTNESGEKKMRGDTKQKMGDTTESGVKETAERFIANLKTDGFGKCTTEKYLKGTTSIILMETKRTTTCPTCGASLGMNIAICTRGNAKTTKPETTEQKSESASDVRSTNPSTNTPSDQRAPITVIAKSVSANTSESGEKKTENTTTNICENIDETTKRYLYTSKSSKADRNAGLPPGETNDWPTVKPTDLMGWLLRLVEMPERNLILDPFCGSGTTAYVCQQMGLPCVAIDQSEEACELTAKRLSEPSLFS